MTYAGSIDQQVSRAGGYVDRNRTTPGAIALRSVGVSRAVHYLGGNGSVTGRVSPEQSGGCGADYGRPAEVRAPAVECNRSHTAGRPARNQTIDLIRRNKEQGRRPSDTGAI